MAEEPLPGRCQQSSPQDYNVCSILLLTLVAEEPLPGRPKGAEPETTVMWTRDIYKGADTGLYKTLDLVHIPCVIPAFPIEWKAECIFILIDYFRSSEANHAGYAFWPQGDWVISEKNATEDESSTVEVKQHTSKKICCQRGGLRGIKTHKLSETRIKCIKICDKAKMLLLEGNV